MPGISGCDRDTQRGMADAGASLAGAWPTNWQGVTLADELWNVGNASGPEHVALGSIGGVTFIGSRLAISDNHSQRIHWYDEFGEHEVSAGRRGDGPGEFFSVGSLATLPDGTLAALNIGGSVEMFDGRGKSKEGVRFPGRPKDFCAIDSTLIVLGTLSGSYRPLHLMDLGGREGEWTSIGDSDAPPRESRHPRSLASNLLDGSIGCMAERVVYARSSDGTVRALSKDGTLLWDMKVPLFTAAVHENAGERGTRVGPPAGATEVHSFLDVVQVYATVAVQVLRLDVSSADRPRDARRSITTLFINLSSGEILGTNSSLPHMVAVSEGRIAVTRETLVPEVAVYSAAYSGSF